MIYFLPMEYREILSLYARYYELQAKLSTFPPSYNPTAKELGIEPKSGLYQQIFRDIKALREKRVLPEKTKIIDFLCYLSSEFLFSIIERSKKYFKLLNAPQIIFTMAEAGEPEALNMVRLALRNPNLILDSEILENLAESYFKDIEDREGPKKNFKNEFLIVFKIFDLIKTGQLTISDYRRFSEKMEKAYFNISKDL